MTAAQQAEEMTLLRNDLAITRKKLVRLESQDEVEREQRGENVVVVGVPEWADTNGHGTEQESHVSGCGNRCSLTI